MKLKYSYLEEVEPVNHIQEHTLSSQNHLISTKEGKHILPQNSMRDLASKNFLYLYTYKQEEKYGLGRIKS